MINSFRGDNYFLSNFFPFDFEFEGESYPTAEHAFQAAKTKDPAWKKRIRCADEPGKAKHLGRRAPLEGGRKVWDARRVDVMREVLRAKFADRVMAGRLLETGNEQLIEGNYWHDTYWGQVKDRGENKLGKLLMELRKELRGGSKA